MISTREGRGLSGEGARGKDVKWWHTKCGSDIWIGGVRQGEEGCMGQSQVVWSRVADVGGVWQCHDACRVAVSWANFVGRARLNVGNVVCCAAAIAAGLKGGEFDGVGFPCHFHNVPQKLRDIHRDAGTGWKLELVEKVLASAFDFSSLSWWYRLSDNICCSSQDFMPD